MTTKAIDQWPVGRFPRRACFNETGEGRRFLPTLVYDVERAHGGMVAVENPRIQRPYPGGIGVGMGLGSDRKAQYLQCELKPIDHRVGVRGMRHRAGFLEGNSGGKNRGLWDSSLIDWITLIVWGTLSIDLPFFLVIDFLRNVSRTAKTCPRPRKILTVFLSVAFESSGRKKLPSD